MKQLLFLAPLFALGCNLTQDLGGAGRAVEAHVTTSATTSLPQGGAGGGTAVAGGGGGTTVAFGTWGTSGAGGGGGAGGAASATTCDFGVYTTDKPLCDDCLGRSCCAQFHACIADATCLGCATNQPDFDCPPNTLLQELESCWNNECSEPCGQIPRPNGVEPRP